MSVLVLTDDESSQHLLSEFFTSRKREVTLCLEARLARQYLESHSYRYVLVDLRLGPPAIEICRLVRELAHLDEVYVLALTDAATPGELREALGAGIDDYLTKPIDRDVLKLRLALGERHMASRKNHSELAAQLAQSAEELAISERNLSAREQYFRALLENSTDLITIIDTEGQILYQSLSSKMHLGLDAEHMFGQSFYEYLDPEDRRNFSQQVREAALAGASPEPAELRFRHLNGEWRYLQTVANNRLDDPVVAGIVLNSRDVTEQHLIQANFHELFSSSPSGIVILDKEGCVIDANNSFVDLFLYEIDDIRGGRLREFIVPPDQEKSSDELVHTVADGQRVVVDTIRQRRDGTQIDVQLISYSISVDGRAMGAFRIYSDITARKQAEREHFHKAFHDALTGLPNRPRILDRLRGCLARGKRHPEYQFALLFIDLDRFKEINDTLGHQAGDELLIEVAKRLKNCVRPGDTVARLAGDEFTVLLDDLHSTGDATQIAARVREKIAVPFEIPSSPEPIRNSASIGIAFSNPRYLEADEILRDADIAMYRAKRGGKNRYEIFDGDLQRTADEHQELETELRSAIEENQLELLYQPVFSLVTKRLVGFEALLHWHHPTKGPMPPEAVVEFGEQTGLIVPIGRWVLSNVCRQVRRWQERFPDSDGVFVSLNVSPNELLHESYIQKVDEVCRETGIKPTAIGVEVHHDALIKEGERLQDPLWELGQRGFRLYLDDFGDSQASLVWLHKLPFEALKVDRRLFMGLRAGSRQAAVLRSIAALGESLGAPVIAKGVEREEQLVEVEKLEFEAAQGFIFSEPVPRERAAEIIGKGLPWPVEVDTTVRTHVEPSGSVLPSRRAPLV